MNNLSKVFRYVNENGESLTFTFDEGLLINKPVGIDTVQVSLTQAQGINQVGATVQSTNVQPRAVTVNGRLVGEFQQEMKNRLLSVVRPDLKARFYADDYYLDVQPTATPTISPEPQFANFQFSVLAPYPYWQHDESVSAELTGIEYGFKFPVNLSQTYRFGELIITQFVNVPNFGQLPVPFTVTFNALNAVVNPRIVNAKTNAVLQIRKTLEAGEKVTVQITHGKTYVTSSVDGDIRGALSLSSNLYRLDVGDNVLKPEADSGFENLTVSIDFATEIVGVAL